MSDEVASHQVSRRLFESVYYPAHPPRKASAKYHRTHKHLINVLDEPCWICGVRKSTLSDPAQNPRGANAMETHHDNVEWALANAMDATKLLADFPEMGAADDPHLREWLDSEGNMMVLCNVCHRDGQRGIHMITYPVWKAQRWERYDLMSPPPALPSLPAPRQPS